MYLVDNEIGNLYVYGFKASFSLTYVKRTGKKLNDMTSPSPTLQGVGRFINCHLCFI
jgi:hypothetical protein